MTRAATGARPACSDRYYEIGSLDRAGLEALLRRGEKPDLSTLEGWEFRGMNTPFWASWIGIKKFLKGFRAEGGRTTGYNCPVVQNSIREPWIAKPSDDSPRRFGFYLVVPVEAGPFSNAALLDYGRGDNLAVDPVRGLRDYLVRPDPGNDDLFLGKAYYALGPLWLPVSYFVLERHRRAAEPGTPTTSGRS